jgi:hypothetical protein
MTIRGWILGAVVALTAGGCASVPFIDAAQPHAIDAAQRRAQFEANCPAATGQVISRELIQTPSLPARWTPPQRAEYTIGVAGCNQRWTYLVVCAEGGGCVAGGGRMEKQQ